MKPSSFASFASCAALAVTMAFAPACTSDDTREGKAPGPISFAPEAQVEGPSVALRGRLDPLAPGHVVVDVIARGAADVHGAAFRVTWDPEALAFLESTSGAAWSKTALALVKEGSPGQLAVAWTEKGELGVDATNDTLLGTLVFEVKGRKGTPLAFKTERSQLVDKKGAPIAARWLNDALGAR